MLEIDLEHAPAPTFRLRVTATIGDGVTALFGPSGSGKTTLVELIAGLRRPGRGSIRLGGRTLVDTAAGIRLPPERRHVGVVFQDHRLLPHRDVAGNLDFGARAARRPIDRTRVITVLELGPLLHRRPATLSGGERQRVAIGRALVRGPDLLLLDEPLASVDAPRRDRVLGFLERVLETWRIPTVHVTHDQAEVRRLAQDVLLLDGGCVVAQGPPDTVLARPEVLGRRGDAGPVNLLRLEGLRATPDGPRGRLGGGELAVSGELPAAPDRGPADRAPSAWVQFRPDDVILARRDPDGLSVRNHVPGTVRELVTAGPAVFVLVDVGQPLWAEITPAAARELELAPGTPVICLVKARRARIVG